MSRGEIDESTEGLLQFFKEPLVLSPQVSAGARTPQPINEVVSRLIFGSPADGAKLTSTIVSDLKENGTPENDVPLIILGTTEADNFNTPEAWSNIPDGRAVQRVSNVASTGDSSTPSTKLSLMFAMSNGVGVGNRSTTGLSLFFNSIPTEQLSLCQPYLSVQMITGQMGTNDQGRATGATMIKFLEGARDVSAEPAYVKMLAGNGTSQAGEPGSMSSLAGSAGMELFTAPQTLVPTSDYADHDPELRGVPIIDRFRPFMSLKDITINSHNSGHGTISYKEGSMSLVLHDRSRMAEIADLLNPGQFASAKFLVEWGWSHPHSIYSTVDNPYGRFLNSLRKKEVFKVKNYKLNFDDVGQVNINLELFTPAAASLSNQNISSGPGLSGDNYIQQLDTLTNTIGRALGILRSEGLVANIRGNEVLGSMASASSIPNLNTRIDGRSVSSHLKRIKEDLRKVTSNQTATSQAQASAQELIASLDDVYNPNAGPQRDRDTVVRKAYNQISAAVDAKIKLLAGDKTTTADPFKAITEVYGGADVPADSYYKLGPPFVTLAKLLTIFVGQPMQEDSDEYSEVHMIFHQFNNQAGRMGVLKGDKRPAANIGQFLINIDEFKKSITRMFQAQRSLEMSSDQFIKFVLTNFVDDRSSVNYGIQKFYRSQVNETTGQVTVSRLKRYRRLSNERLTDSIGEELQAHCKFTEFRMPTVEMMFETIPIARSDADDTNLRQEILKIHIFDRQSSPFPSSPNTLRSEYGANLDANVDQDDPPGDTAPPPGGETPPNQEAAPSPAGLTRSSGTRMNEVIRQIRKNVPTIIYGASASVIKSAKLSTMQDNSLSTLIITGGGPNPTPLTPTGLGGGNLPLTVFPTQLNMTMMGCPILEYMQQLFVDFGTGTSVDNIYHATKITHKISQGSFETAVTFTFVDAYGTFRVQSAELPAMASASEARTNPGSAT